MPRSDLARSRIDGAADLKLPRVEGGEGCVRPDRCSVTLCGVESPELSAAQLERYLGVLGVTAGPPSLENLRALVRAHLTRVPFENISKLLEQVRPFPGTEIHEQFRSLGLLDRELTPEDLVHSDTPLCPTLHLSARELAVGKSRIRRAGVLQPGYLWRFLRERRVRPRHLGLFVPLLLGRTMLEGGSKPRGRRPPA